MGKEIAIFTNTYPYGTGETFLAEEIPFVSGEFEKVHIFPLYIPDSETKALGRQAPSNAIVHRPLLATDHKDRKGLLAGGLLNTAPFGFAVREFFARKVYCSKKKMWLWGNYLCILRSILGNNRKMKEVVGILEGCSCAYFYWGDKSALAIPFLKKKVQQGKKPQFVVRFHGSDLYEEAKGYLPFREMLYGAVDYAVTISENGKEYIEKNYRNQPGEIKVFRLGSSYHSDACPNLGAPVPADAGAADSTGAYNILSCSNVIELKRIDLIAAAMLILERDGELARSLASKGISHICWTHIGDGPLLEPIKELLIQNGAPEGEEGELTPIAFNFLGALPHSKVLEYYQTHYTDLFLQVSRSEGIPVSIMEALSYGTPAMATNVGGVAELLPKGCGCGRLLPKELDALQLAQYVKEWILQSLELPEFDLALAARRQWEEKWDCRKNYTAFARFLKGLQQ